MADELKKKTVIARVTQPRAKSTAAIVKTGYCNVFGIRENPDDMVLNFGFRESGGRTEGGVQQVQLLHKVILSVATARRLRDTLSALFQKRDAPRVRVKAKVVPRRKPN